jgi:hypothetical protein
MKDEFDNHPAVECTAAFFEHTTGNMQKKALNSGRTKPLPTDEPESFTRSRDDKTHPASTDAADQYSVFVIFLEPEID